MAIVKADLSALRAINATWENLLASGLSEEIIETSGIMPATPDYLPQNWSGEAAYVIPFHGPDGKREWWRTRLIPPMGDQKYHQVGYNHIYLPPQIPIEVWSDVNKPLIVVEGEKKALRAWQAGFYSFALTGVASWIRKLYKLPANQIKPLSKQFVQYHTEGSTPEFQGKTAEWLHRLVMRGPHDAHRLIYLIFDSPDVWLNDQVHRASFEFGLWCWFQGARVIQIKLPIPAGEEGRKFGLDDWLTYYDQKALAEGREPDGAQRLQMLLDDEQFQFPDHPNLAGWLREVEARAKANRESAEVMAKAILTDLDVHGKRYADPDEDMYYYLERGADNHRRLYSFALNKRDLEGLRNSDFGRLLMRNYFIRTADSALLSMLADLYTTEQPYGIVHPHRLTATSPLGDAVYIQYSDTHYVKVTGDPKLPWVTQDNGTEVMFHSGVVEDTLDYPKLTTYLDELRTGARKPLLMQRMIDSTNVRPISELDRGDTANLLTAVFYAVPWLRGWRGTQMPVIQVLGESNSGKSSVAETWRWVMTGQAKLNDLSGDLKDWKTNVIHTAGVFVADNANNVDNDLRRQVNDEIARLVTSKVPMFEMRMYYTTAKPVRYRVDTSFALTAITTPFTSNDVVERSVTMRLNKIMRGENRNWTKEWQKDRELWLAEQIYVLHCFLHLAVQQEQWLEDDFRSQHRLNNFEQAIYFMLQVVGVEASRARLIAAQLQASVIDEIRSLDATMEAMQQFADWWWNKNQDKTCTVRQFFHEWVNQHLGEYGDLPAFESDRKFGRWLTNNEGALEQMCGIVFRHVSNQRCLVVLPPHERGKPRDPSISYV